MTMSNQEQNTDAVYEAPTRKPVDIDGEAFIAFRFVRACTFTSLSLTDGAVLIGGTLGEEDLSERFSPDGAEVKAGTFLVLNVRNEGDHAQEIVATIHAHGEHGPEAEVIPLFANGSPLDSVRRDPTASTANGTPPPRGIPPIVIAASENDERAHETNASLSATASPGPRPAARARSSLGDVRLLIFRPDVEALLSVFELGAPLSEMARASLDSQLAADPVSDEVTSSQNDVILSFASVDAERLREAIQFHQEYDLEDTGILIEGLQVALGLIKVSPQEDSQKDEVQNESEGRGAAVEDQSTEQLTQNDKANEGSLLSIAETIPGSSLDRNRTTEIVPDRGDPPGNNGEGRDEHSSAVS